MKSIKTDTNNEGTSDMLRLIALSIAVSGEIIAVADFYHAKAIMLGIILYIAVLGNYAIEYRKPMADCAFIALLVFSMRNIILGTGNVLTIIIMGLLLLNMTVTLITAICKSREQKLKVESTSLKDVNS